MKLNLALRWISRGVLVIGLVVNLLIILPAFNNQNTYTLIDLVSLLLRSNTIYIVLFILTFIPRTQFFQTLLLFIANVGVTSYFILRLIGEGLTPRFYYSDSLYSDSLYSDSLYSDSLYSDYSLADAHLFIFDLSFYVQLSILIPIVVVYLILYLVIYMLTKQKGLQK